MNKQHGRRFVAGLVKRRLAQLNRMMFLRLHFGAEQEEVPVREEGEAVAADSFLDLLRDQPVGHQNVFAGQPVVEHVQDILTVRRLHDPLDDHPLGL